MDQQAINVRWSHEVSLVSQGDTLSSLFHEHHLPQKTMMQIVALGDEVAPLLKLRPGQEIRWIIQEGELTHLIMTIDQNDLMIVRRDEEGHYRVRHVPLRQVVHFKHFYLPIEDSLYESASRAGLSKWLADKSIWIFKDQVNLSKASQRGDVLSGTVEEVNLGPDDPQLSWVSYASLQRDGKAWQAARYVDHRGRVGYYQANGHNIHLTFAPYPVQFRRVSSTFSRHRLNPVLHRYMAHLGVDLAAARGTAIHATADGRVSFAGRNGGYGLEVVIRHEGGLETRYAHMSRLAKLKRGQWVKRDQVIGYVGSTGRSTGPHLHYEVRKHGRACDPLKVKLPMGHSLFGEELKTFQSWWQVCLQRREHEK